MLYSPDQHQALTERGWDEAWVRARIDDVVADATGAVDGHGLWAEHPDDHEDDASLRRGVYLGAAGMVWGLHALGHDRPDLVRGLYEAYLREPDWPGLEAGYWGGEAGILFVTWLVDPAAADLGALEAAIRRNADHASTELMWGAPGTMLLAQAMHAATGEQRWADAWLHSAELLWSRWLADEQLGCHIWTQLLYGQTARYVGPGHGFAGNVLALWQGRHLLGAERAAELERRTVETATALAVREQDTANWPPTVGPLAPRGRIRVQWCHGAAGMVTSLASIAGDDERFSELLRAGGELTWRAGPLANGQGLCHGTAGNGVAFLQLHQRTGEPVWLERARRFAVHALEQVQSERREHGMGRYSLWTGDIGAAVMAQACIAPQAGMPSLDWF